MLWEASNASNYRAWGIPAVLSGIPGKALRAFPEFLPEFLPESPSRTGGMAQMNCLKNILRFFSPENVKWACS